MKRLANARPDVTCATCRRFDGLTWCKQWNQPTSADAPICGSYLARKPGPLRDSVDVFPTADQDRLTPG